MGGPMGMIFDLSPFGEIEPQGVDDEGFAMGFEIPMESPRSPSFPMAWRGFRRSGSAN